MAWNWEKPSFEAQLPQWEQIKMREIVKSYLQDHPIPPEIQAELAQLEQGYKDWCEQCMGDSKLARQALIADIDKNQGQPLEGEKSDLASQARVAVLNCNAQTSLKDEGLNLSWWWKVAFSPPNQMKIGKEDYTIIASEWIIFRDIVVTKDAVWFLIDKTPWNTSQIEMMPKSSFCEAIDRTLQNPPWELYAWRVRIEKNIS